MKCRVLRVSDALCVAGFGLALLRLVWSDSSWRALSNGGTFVQIGGVFSFNECSVCDLNRLRRYRKSRWVLNTYF